MDIAIEKKKGFKKKHIPYVLGALLLAFVVWLIASDHSSTLKVDSRSVTIGKAEKGPFKDYIRINAQVQPMTTIHLSTTEGGVVEMRNVEEGAVVRKGDVIVTLSNLSLRVSILRSEAELAEKENILRDTKLKLEQDKLDLQQQRLDAEVKFRQDKRKFEQYEKLFEERLISKEEYLQAKEAYSLAELRLEVLINRQRQDSLQREVQIEQLENSLDNMRENMVLVRQQLENLSVKSPIDGQVGRLDAELGQWISAGTKIAQINDLTDFKLQAQVDEHYIDKVQTGLSASYEETGGHEIFPARQESLSRSAERPVQDRPPFRGRSARKHPNGQKLLYQYRAGRADRSGDDPARNVLPENGRQLDLRALARGRPRFQAADQDRPSEPFVLRGDRGTRSRARKSSFRATRLTGITTFSC